MLGHGKVSFVLGRMSHYT